MDDQPVSSLGKTLESGSASAPTRIRISDAADMSLVRDLFCEYADWLGVDLCFQGFEKELVELPGKYARPDGRLLLAKENEKIVGCVALRPLEPEICEMKRLYVRPEFRGAGAGRLLAECIVAEGRAIGYRAMRLDTLPRMAAAMSLYRSLGFREIAPYYPNPIASAVYMELALAQ